MSDDFHLQVRNVERFQRDLQKFAHRAVPFAARNALNRSAFALRENWQGEIRRTMILRNKYTAGSIRVEQERGLALHRMQSRTGSIADYMVTQEDGGTVRGKSGAKAIPTEVAAGQAMGSSPRTKLVRAPNKVTALPRTKRGGSRSRTARNARAIAQAFGSGGKVAFLELNGGRKGLYRVMGTKKRPRVRKLWDLSRRSVKVKANPTLERSYKRTLRAFPAIYSKSLLEQLRRHKVLGF